MDTITVDSIISQALQKPENERARIAETLISSLDQTIDLDTELAWQEEIEKRLKEIDTGNVQCLPWKNIRRRLHKNAHVVY